MTNTRYTNFRGADLSGANFKGCDLDPKNLQGACLNGANLDGAHFHLNGQRIPANVETVQQMSAMFGFSAQNVSAAPALFNPLMDLDIADSMQAALVAARDQGAIAALASMGESGAMREPPPDRGGPHIAEFENATFAVAEAGPNGANVGAAGGTMSDAVREAQQSTQLA